MRLDSSSIRKISSKKWKNKSRSNSRYLFKFGSIDWQWYEPTADSAHVHFLIDTSLHGLRYLGQPKRHICERIFWLIAFIGAVSFATILIWHMWDNYKRMPIVTVFNPTEKTLDKIPFPSVTICSVNNIKKSKWDDYVLNVKLGPAGAVSNSTFLQSIANIWDVNHICKSGKTFTQKFYDYEYWSDAHYGNFSDYWTQFRPLLNARATLRNSAQSCEEMILFCLWLDTVTDCSKLFQQIETDYGYCCTFNMIPISLLRTYVKDNRDDPGRVEDWKNADLNTENLIQLDEHGDRKYPHRQLYAGRSAGLSFLVDPNMEEYHCTNADSDGFVIGLNTPLDFPRMKDSEIAVRTGTEVFVSIRPDITISADSARKASFEKRHCYFDGEKNLTHYTKYTTSNCLDECIAKETLKHCHCIRYFMPRTNNNESHCPPWEYDCTDGVKALMISKGMETQCSDCWPSCSEIKFHTDVTSLRIRENHITELLKHFPNKSLNEKRAKHASIIHVFYNVDSVFPRLRKEMYTAIELISNAGGLLGLCMGFSVLSLLEILYHATIRLFCNAYRERCSNEVEDLQKLNSDDSEHDYGNAKSVGFFAKVFSRDPSMNNNHSDWDTYDSGGSNIGRPVNFRTPLERNFPKTFVSTTWMQSQPLSDI